MEKRDTRGRKVMGLGQEKLGKVHDIGARSNRAIDGEATQNPITF